MTTRSYKLRRTYHLFFLCFQSKLCVPAILASKLCSRSRPQLWGARLQILCISMSLVIEDDAVAAVLASKLCSRLTQEAWGLDGSYAWNFLFPRVSFSKTVYLIIIWCWNWCYGPSSGTKIVLSLEVWPPTWTLARGSELWKADCTYFIILRKSPQPSGTLTMDDPRCTWMNL